MKTAVVLEGREGDGEGRAGLSADSASSASWPAGEIPVLLVAVSLVGCHSHPAPRLQLNPILM